MFAYVGWCSYFHDAPDLRKVAFMIIFAINISNITY